LALFGFVSRKLKLGRHFAEKPVRSRRREVVARRKRYQEVRAKFAAGEVRSINDLITYNLDTRQFAQHVIENCEGPELLRAFYHAIENVTVLDRLAAPAPSCSPASTFWSRSTKRA